MNTPNAQSYRELRKLLVKSRFEFLPRGRLHMREICKAVKEKYPELCMDDYTYDQHCPAAKMGKTPGPAWWHAVRTALRDLTRRHRTGRTAPGICKDAQHGWWVFRMEGS